MATNSINTQTSDKPISEKEAEKLLEDIRKIMAKTSEPFGPAVNLYIKEKYVNKD